MANHWQLTLPEILKTEVGNKFAKLSKVELICRYFRAKISHCFLQMGKIITLEPKV